MKTILSITLVFLLLSGFSQSTIWSEDFSSYADNSGYIGSNSGAVTTGDYPASVAKWTLDVSEGTLSNTNDWFMVNDILGNNQFEARDIDGPCIWQSEDIDISGFLDVSFELVASRDGDFESTDYIDVEYRIGTGSWTLLPNWNGQGTAAHTLIGNFTSPQTPSITGLSGNMLQLRVTMMLNASTEYYRFDDVLVEGFISPVADFSAENLSPTTIESVPFNDLSTNSPTSWNWTFDPPTVTFVIGNSNSQNPQVKFDAIGLYTVSLTVQNSAGSDLETKTDYINVTEPTSPLTLTNPDTYYITVPDNVYTIQNQVYGGGGGGAGTHTPNGGDDGGGAGGGAGYCGGTLNVNPGDILTIVVGAGGDGGDDDQNGSDGGSSSVTHNTSSESVTANGGNGGLSENNGGTGGSGGTGIYTGGVVYPITFSGGTGANGNTQNGGGGGGGAGDSNDGSPGSGTNGGAGGNANGGAGGDGSTNNALGGNGSTYGGGGGGASDNEPSVGGNGADGAVIITWTAASIWTGNTSKDWNISTNWSENVLPPVGMDILIPSSPSGGFFPETNSGSGVDCGRLIIQSGAYVFIPFDNSITVNGLLTNEAGNSGLVIQSSASGTGSLIHSTNGVDATVQQALSEDRWHYVSSPMSNATSNVFYDIYLKPFNEPTYTWGDYIISTNESLNVMQGYSAWTYDPVTVSFEGSLNNGSQNINVTYTPQTNPGWNFVGNPYPSALDWDAPGWDKTNIDNTIYFYEGNGLGGLGNYRYYVGSGGLPGVGTETGSGIIPAMQGFFVKATANSILSVSNGARVHSDQIYYKEGTDNNIPILRLATTDINGLTDEAIIRFYEEATIEHDGNYDAFKLFGWMYPQLYSITPEQSELAINTLPANENGTIIPLGFIAPEEGEYSITLTEFKNFELGTEVYLEDLLTGTIHNISENSEYSFASNPEQDPNRFLLNFNNTLGMDRNQVKDIKIYSYENIIYVKSLDLANMDITVYNLIGQEITCKQLGGSILSKIRISSGKGYYIVKVQTDESYVTKKVFIK